MDDFKEIIELQEKLKDSFTTEEQEVLFIRYNGLIVKRTENMMSMLEESTRLLTGIQEKMSNLES